MWLWHIAERAEWAACKDATSYAPAAFARDGFIHLSTDAQWPRALDRFYRARPREELVLLVIDGDRIAGDLRFELADGELFPHLYARLPRAAVVEIRSMV